MNQMASKKRRTKYIEGVKRTKTYTYLFEPSVAMFHNDDVKVPFASFSTGIRIINVFLGDTDLNKYKVEDGILHILCDLSGPHAAGRLKQLQKSQYYVDCYIINRSPKVGVILFRAFRGKSYDKFLKSKYNEMYSDTLLEAVKHKFRTPPTKPGETSDYTHAFKVLSDDESLREEWANKIDVEPEEVQQLASKLNLKKEIVSIKEYYESVQDKL
jgi:hypothetical protein